MSEDEQIQQEAVRKGGLEIEKRIRIIRLEKEEKEEKEETQWKLDVGNTDIETYKEWKEALEKEMEQ